MQRPGKQILQELFAGIHIAESFGQTFNIVFETRGSTSNVSIRGIW
jgi:hypothetical protein